MRDNETFKANEYNIFSEVKSLKKDVFTIAEDQKIKEDFIIPEENKTKRLDTPTVRTAIKQTENIKDKLIGKASTTLKTIVTTATTAVAATTVVVTTLLSPSPTVKDINFEVGNDYVYYSLDIDQLDPQRTYKIEVKNSLFSYSVDLDYDESKENNIFEDYIYGLKPNYKYDFNLLQDNGEIGGYSLFYSTNFYTLKVEDPKPIFAFNYLNDSLEYSITLSDYYGLCSNTYYTFNSTDLESDSIPFNGSITSSLIPNNLPITFYVYGTLYEQNTLLGQYTYYFNQIESNYSDNLLHVNGFLGSQYDKVKEPVLTLETYNQNGNLIESFTSLIKSNANISFDFSPTLDFISYEIMIVDNETILYDSSLITLKFIPDITFTGQQLSTTNLRVYSPNITINSSVTFSDINLKDIVITAGAGYFDIPLCNDDYIYYRIADYTLEIDGFTYQFEPDRSELVVGDIKAYSLNEKTFIDISNYCSLYFDKNLVIKVNDQETLIEEGKCTIPNTFEPTFEISCYLIDEENNSVSQVISRTIDNALFSAETGVSENELSISIEKPLDVDLLVKYYNENKQVIAYGRSEVIYSEEVISYNESLTDDIYFVNFALLFDGFTVIESDLEARIGPNITSRVVNGNGYTLYVTGLNALCEGYINDRYEEQTPIEFGDGYMKLPVSYDKDMYIYSDITVNNGFETKIIDVSPDQTYLALKNVRYDNSYGNDSLQFSPSIISNIDDFSLAVEAYSNDTLLTNADVKLEDFYDNISVFESFNSEYSEYSNISFVFYLKDSLNNVLCEKITYFMEDSIRTTSLGFNCRAPNPVDIPVTHNDDGTINFTVPVNFTTDDPDIILEIILYDYRNNLTYIVAISDYVAVFTNYIDTTYSIIYQVVKRGSMMDFVYSYVYPSGSINEVIN